MNHSVNNEEDGKEKEQIGGKTREWFCIHSIYILCNQIIPGSIPSISKCSQENLLQSTAASSFNFNIPRYMLIAKPITPDNTTLLFGIGRSDKLEIIESLQFRDFYWFQGCIGFSTTQHDPYSESGWDQTDHYQNNFSKSFWIGLENCKNCGKKLKTLVLF